MANPDSAALSSISTVKSVGSLLSCTASSTSSCLLCRRKARSAISQVAPSNRADTASTAKLIQGASTSWGWRILSTPSRMETPAPRPKIRMATTKVQKYSSSPWPKGCSGVAGRTDRRRPYSIRSWFPLSTSEWMASLSMALLPVHQAAANFVTAMARLPARAAKMVVLESCAIEEERSGGRQLPRAALKPAGCGPLASHSRLGARTACGRVAGHRSGSVVDAVQTAGEVSLALLRDGNADQP